MVATRFGPGSVTFKIGAAAALPFQQEVKGGGINHNYEDVGEAVTYLDGTVDPAGKQRLDVLTLDCDFDLGSAGLYAYLNTNDMQPATAEFTPNTAKAAKWAGTVVLQLPDGAVADEYGGKLSGTVELDFIGHPTFTPAP